MPNPRLPPRLSTLQLNRALLARQGLLKRRRMTVAAALHAFGGLQSQEPKDPYVALWSRLSGFRADHLRAAAERRQIVRGTYLRSTLHTVEAGDYCAFRPLLQGVVDRELDIAQWRAVSGGFEGEAVEPLARKLMALQPLSAQALGEALLPHFPRAQKAGLGHWVRTRIALAIVPSDDRWGYPRPPRFVPAEQWLQRPLASSQVADLLLHGLAAIGPASAADLRVWSGLRGLKPELEALRPQLRVFVDESGRELFDLPDAPRPRADTPAPVRFLPEYDNVFLSHEDRARILSPRHAGRLAQSANGRRPRAVLIDGFVQAGWSWERVRDAATIRVEPFEALSRTLHDEVAAEAEALLHFLEPDAGSHVVEVR